MDRKQSKVARRGNEEKPRKRGGSRPQGGKGAYDQDDGDSSCLQLCWHYNEGKAGSGKGCTFQNCKFSHTTPDACRRTNRNFYLPAERPSKQVDSSAAGNSARSESLDPGDSAGHPTLPPPPPTPRQVAEAAYERAEEEARLRLPSINAPRRQRDAHKARYGNNPFDPKLPLYNAVPLPLLTDAEVLCNKYDLDIGREHYSGGTRGQTPVSCTWSSPREDWDAYVITNCVPRQRMLGPGYTVMASSGGVRFVQKSELAAGQIEFENDSFVSVMPWVEMTGYLPVAQEGVAVLWQSSDGEFNASMTVDPLAILMATDKDHREATRSQFQPGRGAPVEVTALEAWYVPGGTIVAMDVGERLRYVVPLDWISQAYSTLILNPKRGPETYQRLVVAVSRYSMNVAAEAGMAPADVNIMVHLAAWAVYADVERVYNVYQAAWATDVEHLNESIDGVRHCRCRPTWGGMLPLLCAVFFLFMSVVTHLPTRKGGCMAFDNGHSPPPHSPATLAPSQQTSSPTAVPTALPSGEYWACFDADTKFGIIDSFAVIFGLVALVVNIRVHYGAHRLFMGAPPVEVKRRVLPAFTFGRDIMQGDWITDASVTGAFIRGTASKNSLDLRGPFFKNPRPSRTTTTLQCIGFAPADVPAPTCFARDVRTTLGALGRLVAPTFSAIDTWRLPSNEVWLKMLQLRAYIPTADCTFPREIVAPGVVSWLEHYKESVAKPRFNLVLRGASGESPHDVGLAAVDAKNGLANGRTEASGKLEAGWKRMRNIENRPPAMVVGLGVGSYAAKKLISERFGMPPEGWSTRIWHTRFTFAPGRTRDQLSQYGKFIYDRDMFTWTYDFSRWDGSVSEAMLNLMYTIFQNNATCKEACDWNDVLFSLTTHHTTMRAGQASAAKVSTTGKVTTGCAFTTVGNTMLHYLMMMVTVDCLGLKDYLVWLIAGGDDGAITFRSDVPVAKVNSIPAFIREEFVMKLDPFVFAATPAQATFFSGQWWRTDDGRYAFCPLLFKQLAKIGYIVDPQGRPLERYKAKVMSCLAEMRGHPVGEHLMRKWLLDSQMPGQARSSRHDLSGETHRPGHDQRKHPETRNLAREEFENWYDVPADWILNNVTAFGRADLGWQCARDGVEGEPNQTVLREHSDVLIHVEDAEPPSKKTYQAYVSRLEGLIAQARRPFDRAGESDFLAPCVRVNRYAEPVEEKHRRAEVETHLDALVGRYKRPPAHVTAWKISRGYLLVGTLIAALLIAGGLTAAYATMSDPLPGRPLAQAEAPVLWDDWWTAADGLPPGTPPVPHESALEIIKTNDRTPGGGVSFLGTSTNRTVVVTVNSSAHGLGPLGNEDWIIRRATRWRRGTSPLPFGRDARGIANPMTGQTNNTAGQQYNTGQHHRVQRWNELWYALCGRRAKPIHRSGNHKGDGPKTLPLVPSPTVVSRLVANQAQRAREPKTKADQERHKLVAAMNRLAVADKRMAHAAHVISGTNVVVAAREKRAAVAALRNVSGGKGKRAFKVAIPRPTGHGETFVRAASTAAQGYSAVHGPIPRCYVRTETLPSGVVRASFCLQSHYLTGSTGTTLGFFMSSPVNAAIRSLVALGPGTFYDTNVVSTVTQLTQLPFSQNQLWNLARGFARYRYTKCRIHYSPLARPIIDTTTPPMYVHAYYQDGALETLSLSYQNVIPAQTAKIFPPWQAWTQDVDVREDAEMKRVQPLGTAVTVTPQDMFQYSQTVLFCSSAVNATTDVPYVGVYFIEGTIELDGALAPGPGAVSLEENARLRAQLEALGVAPTAEPDVPLLPDEIHRGANHKGDGPPKNAAASGGRASQSFERVQRPAASWPDRSQKLQSKIETLRSSPEGSSYRLFPSVTSALLRVPPLAPPPCSRPWM